MAIDNNIPPTYPNQPNRRTEDGHTPDTTTIETGNPKSGIMLLADKYDKNKFAQLNDAEFTELISSIEGVGVDEFFVIYEELKNIIPPGEMDVAFSINGGPDDIFNVLKQAVRFLAKGEVEATAELLKKIQEYTDNLTNFLVTTTPNSHAYLVQTSSRYLTDLNEKFKAVFDYLMLLISQNEALLEENARLNQEVEYLRIKVEELTNTLRKLTAPEPMGFRAIPELFTVETIGTGSLKPGLVYHVEIKGATGAVTASAGIGFESHFTIEKPPTPESSIWKITPHEGLRGKTSYVTFKDVISDMVVATENVVFVIPYVTPPSILQTTTPIVNMKYLDAAFRDKEWAKQLWGRDKEVGTAIITNVVPSIIQTANGELKFDKCATQIDDFDVYEIIDEQFIPDSPYPNPFGLVSEPGTLEVHLRALRPGRALDSLKIKDSQGELYIGVDVESIKFEIPPSQYFQPTVNGRTGDTISGFLPESVATVMIQARKVGPGVTTVIERGENLGWQYPGTPNDVEWEWNNDHGISTVLGVDGLPLYEYQSVNINIHRWGAWQFWISYGSIEAGAPYAILDVFDEGIRP